MFRDSQYHNTNVQVWSSPLHVLRTYFLIGLRNILHYMLCVRQCPEDIFSHGIPKYPVIPFTGSGLKISFKNPLSFITLWANSADDKLMIFS